jgi:hypothetical protein
MYKDKEKQRDAVRDAVRRYRGKGITVIPSDVIPVIPKSVTPVIKTKEDAVKVVSKLSVPDWRVPKVVGCRKFGDSV